MIDKINDLLKRVEAFKPQAAAEVEEFRVRMLGRKGEMNDVFEEFKKVAPELIKELGQKINALKTRINDKIAEMKSALENTEADSDAAIDISGVVGDLETQLADWSVGALLGLWFQSVFVGLCTQILSICIFLVIYGRMIEVYCASRSAACNPQAVRGHFGNPALASR